MYSAQNCARLLRRANGTLHRKRQGGGRSVDKYRCTVCGYIYDPDKGDPDNGVEPGAAFDDMPDDWVCPVCGALQSAFEKV